MLNVKSQEATFSNSRTGSDSASSQYFCNTSADTAVDLDALSHSVLFCMQQDYKKTHTLDI